MTDLQWHELYPSRDMSVAELTGLIRLLGVRPRRGAFQPSPITTLETWSFSGDVRWLLGDESPPSDRVPKFFQAQLPGFTFRSIRPARPLVERAVDVRLTSASVPLRRDVAESVSAGLLAKLTSLHREEIAVLQWVLGPSHQRQQYPSDFGLWSALGFTSNREPDAGARQAWKEKAVEPLFVARCRIGAKAGNPERTLEIIHSLVRILRLSESPGCRLSISRPTEWRARSLHAVHRPGTVWSSVVNAAELAELLGWPLGDIHTGGRSMTLPPAPFMVQVPTGDSQLQKRRILGTSLHPGDGGAPVQMPPSASRYGLHIIGPTGSGKSNLLAQLVLADANAGHTVLCIEPRGDLTEDIISRLPPHRRDDLIVIDPADSDQVGFNPMAGATQHAERRADELMGLFREMFGAAIGPRSSDVLLHTLITAARMSDGTLADVPLLLTNTAFRRRVLPDVGDPLVLTPWWSWYDSLSDGERQQVIAPVLNKLRALLSRQSIRRILGQSHPAFSLDDAFMGRPRVILVNLNRGEIGTESSRLMGGLLLLSAWNALQRRTILPRSERFPVSWYVDEFQDFIGALNFDQVLAEARGLGGQMTLAHQNLAQLTPQLRAATTANARSRLTFRPSADDAKPLAAIFGPLITPEDLRSLEAFQVAVQLCLDGQITDPFGVQTLPLGPPGSDVRELRRISRERYATDGQVLDELLRRRWQGEDHAPDGPIGTRPRRKA